MLLYFLELAPPALVKLKGNIVILSLQLALPIHYCLCNVYQIHTLSQFLFVILGTVDVVYTWKYGGPHILITTCANEMKQYDGNSTMGTKRVVERGPSIFLLFKGRT